MEFTQYQTDASKTFKTHHALTPRQAEILDWALGLPGEAGEVVELIKHYVFHEQALDKMAVAKEVGDILWYCAAICKTLDIPLDAVAELNIAKLEHRHKGIYSHESSAARRTSEGLFTDTEIYAAIEHRIWEGIQAITPDKEGK